MQDMEKLKDREVEENCFAEMPQNANAVGCIRNDEELVGHF